MNVPRIAIIGGGCSGTLLAAQMLRQADRPTHIVLVERTYPIGRGIAYGTKCEDHLLNVPAARMSAWPDKPEHFLRWAQNLKGRLGFILPVGPDDFLPRHLYGHYLAEVLEEARATAAPGVELKLIRSEAIDLEEVAEGGRITLSDGSLIIAAAVVLALGNLPGEYPLKRSLPFYHGRHYVHFPWASDVLDGIRDRDDLLLVGAGLTSVDIVMECRQKGHKGVIHVLSRHGLRPLAHLQDNPKPFPAFLSRDALPTTARKAMALLRRAVRQAEARGVDWRAAVDSIRPFSQQLWQGFSWNERARFMRHVRPFWEAHRHRLAPASFAAVRTLEEAGQLKFHAGRLTSLRDQSDGAAAVIKLRGREEFLALRVAKVVNCTGPRTDYSKYQHPLLINLLAAGLITHDPLALGIAALPTGEVLRFNQKPAGWLFTLGAPLKGALWESTAVAEIRQQARALARRLVAAPEVLPVYG